MESKDLPALRTEKLLDATYQLKLKMYRGLEVDRYLLNKNIYYSNSGDIII